jgi:hypothetical protein
VHTLDRKHRCATQPLGPGAHCGPRTQLHGRQGCASDSYGDMARRWMLEKGLSSVSTIDVSQETKRSNQIFDPLSFSLIFLFYLGPRSCLPSSNFMAMRLIGRRLLPDLYSFDLAEKLKNRRHSK